MDKIRIRDQPKKGSACTLCSDISVLSDVESEHEEVQAEEGPAEDGISDSLHLVDQGHDEVLAGPRGAVNHATIHALALWKHTIASHPWLADCIPLIVRASTDPHSLPIRRLLPLSLLRGHVDRRIPDCSAYPFHACLCYLPHPDLLLIITRLSIKHLFDTYLVTIAKTHLVGGFLRSWVSAATTGAFPAVHGEGASATEVVPILKRESCLSLNMGLPLPQVVCLSLGGHLVQVLRYEKRLEDNEVDEYQCGYGKYHLEHVVIAAIYY